MVERLAMVLVREVKDKQGESKTIHIVAKNQRDLDSSQKLTKMIGLRWYRRGMECSFFPLNSVVDNAGEIFEEGTVVGRTMIWVDLDFTRYIFGVPLVYLRSQRLRAFGPLLVVAYRETR